MVGNGHLVLRNFLLRVNQKAISSSQIAVVYHHINGEYVDFDQARRYPLSSFASRDVEMVLVHVPAMLSARAGSR